MLSHWVVIKDGVIENYQAVVPSTWNCGPRNHDNVAGPYEQSLVGLKIADPKNRWKWCVLSTHSTRAWHVRFILLMLMAVKRYQ